MAANTAAFASDTSDVTGARPETRGGRSSSALVGWLWSGALFVALTFLVAYPVAMLLLGALTDTNPVVHGFGSFNLSLDNFVTVLANRKEPHGVLDLGAADTRIADSIKDGYE